MVGGIKYFFFEIQLKNKKINTKEAMNGAIMDPNLAHIDPDPTPTLRITVGNNSPE